MFECDTCTRTFRTRQSRNQHMDDTDHWYGFACFHCGKVFSTAQGRKSHTEAVHRRERYTATAAPSAFSEPVVTATITEPAPLKQETASAQTLFRTKFLSATASMFNQEASSDAAVLIQDVLLPIHQLVVCLQSPYLKDALQQASDSTGTRRLTFRDVSVIAHWRVFEYLYTGDYSDSTSSEDTMSEDPVLLKHVRVYALASKFLLEHLKSLALSKFQLDLTVAWTSDSFFECVEEVYNTSSCYALRIVVIEAAVTHFHDLATKQAFLDLLHKGGEFARDYFVGVHQRYSLVTWKLRE